MALKFPSMMESLFYEPNDGLMMHGFYFFLIFLTMCIYGVMTLYVDCKMLVIVSREMGIIVIKVVHWLFSPSVWIL